MKFPERIYTTEEVERARELVRKGYKHRLKIKGSENFERKVREALKHLKTTKQYKFLRTYIRQIVEIDGLSQLREAEAAIWLNKYAVEDSVDAASFIIQKAHQMKEFIEGKLYYGGEAELRTVQKRVEFLEKLRKKSRKQEVKERCEEILKFWADSLLL